MSFGIQGWTSNVLQLVNYRLDLFVLAVVASRAVVGRYAIAVAATFDRVGSFPGPRVVFFPRIARLGAAGDEDMQLLVEAKALRISALLCVLGAAVAAFGLEVLVVPVFGEAFSGAVVPGLLLLPGAASVGVSVVLAAALTGRGRPVYALYTALVTTPVTIALYAVLIPWLEATGAAVASTLSYLSDLRAARVLLPAPDQYQRASAAATDARGVERPREPRPATRPMTKRLHVLIITEWYPSPASPNGGIFVRDQALAVARNHDVTVVAPSDPSAPADAIESGIRTLRPGSRRQGTAGRLSRLRALNRIVRLLVATDSRPDVIHAHTFSAGALAVLVGRRWHIPVVVSEHHTDLIEGLVTRRDALIARLTYSRARLVCPVSSILEQAVIALEPRARCRVVENVVDVDAFAPVAARNSRRPRALLTVAGLYRQKGLRYLLEAFRMHVAAHADAQLDVVGDGPQRAELEALATGLPVYFHGALPRHAVAACMRAADALVLPSIVETFGVAAVEGLAADLPMVVTDVFPTANLVSEHGGIVVPAADAEALRRALNALVERDVEASPANLTWLRARFGSEAIGTEWTAVYHALFKES